MSTIYAFTSPARGHLYPLIPILLELSGRGHRVKVWSLAAELERLEGLGLETAPIDPAIEALPIEDWKGRNDMERLRYTFDAWTARAPYEVADLQSALAEGRPDLIITDINCFGAPAPAEAAGVPWATFAPYLTFVRDPDVPPFGPGMKPLGGPLGRLRNGLIGAFMLGVLDRKFLGPINDARAEAGAGPLDSVAEQWTSPRRLLYLTVPELEYPRSSWPESFRFIGPTNWEPRAEPPAWVAEVDRPLILVTASTEYQRDDRLISTGLEALAGEDVFVVATTAGNDPALFTAPDNARVERFLPHGPLLERAEAVVCHGGMGITQKALTAGVPVCTVGWGRDQLESGRRVEVAGAGVLLPRKKLSAERLRDALATARGRRAGAERIAAAIAAAPGAAGAADELEAITAVGARAAA